MVSSVVLAGTMERRQGSAPAPRSFAVFSILLVLILIRLLIRSG